MPPTAPGNHDGHVLSNYPVPNTAYGNRSSQQSSTRGVIISLLETTKIASHGGEVTRPRKRNSSTGELEFSLSSVWLWFECLILVLHEPLSTLCTCFFWGHVQSLLPDWNFHESKTVFFSPLFLWLPALRRCSVIACRINERTNEGEKYRGKWLPGFRWYLGET